MGFALYEAQRGLKPVAAKPLKGFGGAGVMEVVSDYQTDAYRAVYTVKLGERVYVLHAFQKKSKKGIATPKADLELSKEGSGRPKAYMVSGGRNEKIMYEERSGKHESESGPHAK